MSNTDKPKYQKLKDYIIETIESSQLKPGEKIYSENELSDMFEISRHTVRQALGDLVQEGWLFKIQGKGTFVCKSSDQNRKQTKTIGVITTYLNDYIFPSIIRGIDSILSTNGYNMLVGCTYNTHEKERLCIENLLNMDIDGLIIETTKSALPNPNIDLYRQLKLKGIPVLFIHGSYRELDCPYIVEDDVQAGFLAANHLISLGHRKIGGIFKIDDIQGHYRFQGFHKACREGGLSLPDSMVLWFDTGETDIKFKYKGSRRLEALLSECSALVCYNDQIALNVLDVIREMNLHIPDDISIVSFDDSQLAVASEVKLTTVAHPKEKLGEEAANTIIGMISGTNKHLKVKMSPELIIRGSTKKIERKD